MDTPSPSYDWSIAIFAARETPEILVSSLEAALNACNANSVIVDIVVNGNVADNLYRVVIIG